MAEIKFTGALGGDSELRYTPSGQAVLNFSAADSKSKKLDNGEWETLATQWFRVTLWGELAEFFAEKLLKGVRVTVWGDFMSREYEGKNGAGLSLDVTAKGIEVHQKRGQQAAGRSNSGGFGNAGGFGNQPAEDPWGAPSGGNSQGWGNGAASEPPF